MKTKFGVMMLALTVLALAGFIYWPYFSGTKGAEAIEKRRNAPFSAPDPAPFAEVLADLVDAHGMVRYTMATPRHKELLGHYLGEVAEATPAQFSSDDDRLAFYINAYNALVIQRVLELMPIDSVEEAGPLHAFFRERIFRVAGTEVSLHGFESKVIRKYDPLLHFGLNCASISCPPLKPWPYRGDLVKRQLKQATKSFLAHEDYNYFDSGTRTIFLSKIFEWYAEDFGGEAGIRKLLFDFGPPHWPRDAQIRYTNYDWNLNKASADSP